MPQARERAAAVFLFSALVLLAVFWFLGVFVTAHGEPPALLALAKAWRGHAISLAWIFTNFGWVQGFAAFYIAAIVVAIRSRPWRARMVSLILTGLLSWGITDRLQHLFGRPRRADWLVRHEHSFSYPSSHASTTTTFYFYAALLLLFSNLAPRWRYAGFALLTALWLGVCWSRLSLAAHYPTDVAGGIILGLAFVLMSAGVLRLASKTTARV